MLYQILVFLVEVAVTLVGGACLLRFAMHARAMSMRNPLGEFVQALTDWLVLPLRRLLPATVSWDAACLLAAWLLKLLQWAVLLAAMRALHWGLLPVLAALDVARLGITVAMVVIIAGVVLSWTQNRGLLAAVIQRLAEPLLAPFRRVLPLLGGIDLSPLLALVLLQVASIVLRFAQGSLLGGALVPGLA